MSIPGEGLLPQPSGQFQSEVALTLKVLGGGGVGEGSYFREKSIKIQLGFEVCFFIMDENSFGVWREEGGGKEWKEERWRREQEKLCESSKKIVFLIHIKNKFFVFFMMDSWN